MRSSLEPSERPLFWVASSKKDLLAMPEAAIRGIGMALGIAQYGGKGPRKNNFTVFVTGSGCKG